MSWAGEFGNEYTNRNELFCNYKFLETDHLSIFKSFFSEIPRDSRILELGCNTGNNIGVLREMGFNDITGIDVNQYAIVKASARYPDYTFYHSSIEDFTGHYDMVFTSGVLIHIDPDFISTRIDKIKSLSKKYIFGFEYYADNFEKIDYPVPLWKGNYMELFNMKPKRAEIHFTKDFKAYMFYLINSLNS